MGDPVTLRQIRNRINNMRSDRREAERKIARLDKEIPRWETLLAKAEEG